MSNSRLTAWAKLSIGWSWRATVVGAGFAVGLAGAIAAQLSPPFSSGQPLSSTAVNQNFAALNAEVIDLQARVEQLQTTVSEVVSEASYRRSYTDVTTARPRVLLDRDGQDLPRNFVATFVCAAYTDASGTSSWLVKRAGNAEVYIERLGSFASTSGITPEIFNNNGVPSLRLFNSNPPEGYTVLCRTEQVLP